MRCVQTSFDSVSGEQGLALRRLLAGGVRLVIVGGYAMRYYGRQRSTEDLDLVIAQTPENVDRIQEALSPHAPATDAEWRRLMLPEKKMRWWGVDIFSTMRGLIYHELECASEHCPLFDSSVQIVSLPHLKIAKQLAIAAPDREETKRLRDREDLEYLERLDDA